MNTAKKNFFDSRDKYLSFVHTTNEKIKIAFYLSERLDGINPQRPFQVFDAGTGEGTVISTFLTALHQHMPNIPLIVTGKEISTDDICILLGYLADRFAEHPALVFNITNMSYHEINAGGVRCKRVEKALTGKTSYDFGRQLMNMSDFVKRHWEITSSKDGAIKPKQKIFMTLYREDQKIILQHALAENRRQPPNRFDFIIASQPFRLRQPPAVTAQNILAPLLKSLAVGGRMTLFYSSGRDFSKALLHAFYPHLKPFADATPRKRLVALRPLMKENGITAVTDSLRYGFINLYLGRRDFSLTNIYSLWNAVTYVGQISEAEQLEMNRHTLKRLEEKVSSVKNMTFVNHVIHFERK